MKRNTFILCIYFAFNYLFSSCTTFPSVIQTMIPNNEWKNYLNNVIKYLQSEMLRRIRCLRNPAFKQELRKSKNMCIRELSWSLCQEIPQYEARIISNTLAGLCAKGFPSAVTHNIWELSRFLCKGIPQYKAHIISDSLAGPCAKGFPNTMHTQYLRV